MIRQGLILAGLAISLAGCRSEEIVPQPMRFTEYATQDFDWEQIQRVVVMPVANRSDTPQVPEQMQRALVAELQRTGRFEVFMAKNDSEDPHTDEVFSGGKFDEEKLLKISKRYNAQGVLFAKITEYHPYTTPRIGLSLLLVSPAEAVVIAATDGLWDLREAQTQGRARCYVQKNLEFGESLLETDRVLVSPHNFQRFVAYELANALELSTQPDGFGLSPSCPHCPTGECQIHPASYQCKESDMLTIPHGLSPLSGKQFEAPGLP